MRPSSRSPANSAHNCPFLALRSIHLSAQAADHEALSRLLVRAATHAGARIPVALVGRPDHPTIALLRGADLLALLRWRPSRRPPPPAAPAERARASCRQRRSS